MRAAVLSLLLLAPAAPAQALKEGDKVPDVTVPVVNAGDTPGVSDGRLSLHRVAKGGKNVVLFFYPKAMTRGCTAESCGFRDLTAEFAKLDTVVLGISTDPLSDQQKFIDKESLNFPLLADADKSVTKAFGALSERGVASRYTFVIDKQGVVRKVYTKVTPATHTKEVLDYVKASLAK